MKKELEIFGERLVTLCDGRSGLRGGMQVEIRVPEDAGNEPIIEFIASNETLDRYDEIIAVDGWDLTNYRRNPVFQNSHKYGDILFTLGKGLVTEVRQVASAGKALVQRTLFATGINPVAKLAYDMYRQKFLNAVSVGFIPIRWETGSDQSPYRRKYLQQELLELSAVSIPANPDALQLALRAGAVDRSDVRELAQFLKPFCGDEARSESNASAAGSEANAAQLLQFARDLQRMLRGA